MLKVFEYRLRPKRQQARTLDALLESTRQMYNQCLEELIIHYKQTGKHLNRFAHDKLHGVNQHPDLPAVIVDKVLDRVHRSFANFFAGRKEGRNVGFPRFKVRLRWRSLEFRDANNRLEGIYFKAGRKIGDLRAIVHRPLEGTFKFARIVKRASGWYLQCVCEVTAQPLPASDSAVGLDMGITALVADSDGNIVENPKHLRKSLKQLAHAQRGLSRKVKGSQRRRKQGQVVARHHERVANQRKDYLHKVSRDYVNRYQVIAVEDLQVSNMVHNHHLSLSILDASWAMLRDMLAYKAESAGRQFVVVAPHYTSQRCSRCGGYVEKSLSLRTHLCPHCGYIADRDVNAARNILKQARTGPSPSAPMGGAMRREAARIYPQQSVTIPQPLDER